MAKINSFKRVISNDFDQKDQPLIEQLGKYINEGFSPIYNALSNRLTFTENFACTVRDVDITVGADGKPLQRTGVALNNSELVKGCQVIQVINRTNTNSYPTSAPFISFTQSANSLFIDHITGLQANNRYTVRFIAFN